MRQRLERSTRGLLFFLVSSAVGAQEERLLQLVWPAVEQRFTTAVEGDARGVEKARRGSEPRARSASEQGAALRLAAHHPGGPVCSRARAHRIGHPGRLS